MPANRLVAIVLFVAAVIASERAYHTCQFWRAHLNRPEPPLGIDNITFVQTERPFRNPGDGSGFGADTIVAYIWPNSSRVTFQLGADTVGTFFGPVTVDFGDKNSTSFVHKGEKYSMDFCPDANGYYLSAFFFIDGPGLRVKSRLLRRDRNCPDEFRYLIAGNL